MIPKKYKGFSSLTKFLVVFAVVLVPIVFYAGWSALASFTTAVTLKTNPNLTTGLALHYTFDAATSTAIADASGNGITGAYNGVTDTSTVTTFLTSGTSWTRPVGWNNSNNSIECIGPGGLGADGVANTNGGGGGGGGAYAKITNFAAAATESYTVDIGGSQTSTTFGTDSDCVADAGNNGSGTTAGAGGTTGASTGTVVYAGGNGGASGGSDGGGGGGGSAGPLGAGQNGGAGSGASLRGGGGGGGSNGGSSTVGSDSTGTSGGNGGEGTGGTGGGAGSSTGAGTAATAGTGGGGGGGSPQETVDVDGGRAEGDDYWDATHGVSGGGGGAGSRTDACGAPGFMRGGTADAGSGYGGGSGGGGFCTDAAGTGGSTPGPGLIVVTYTPTPTRVTSGRMGQGVMFTGSSDYIATSSGTSIANLQSVAFWARASTTAAIAQGLVNLAGSSIHISTNSSKVISATGVTSPTYYVDGVASSTPGLYDSGWHHVVVTTATPFTSTYLLLGEANGVFFGGSMDDFRLYTKALSASEAARLYQLGGTTYQSVSLSSNDDLSSSASGLVGHWTLDGGDLLQNVTDRSGQGNTAKLVSFSSTTTAPGRSGQALNFDGVNDGVNAGTGSSLDVAGGGATWAAWIYPRDADQTTNYNEAIFDKEDAGAGSGGVFIFLKSNTLCIYDGAATCGSLSVPNNTWTHIALVQSGSSAIPYINGVADTDLIWTGSSQAAVPQSIGYDAQSAGREYDGLLDDVRIYNRGLSEAEVKRLYQLGATSYQSVSLTGSTNLSPAGGSLVGWWTFDGPNMLQSVTDSSGQGNNGYIIGTAATSTKQTAGRLGQAYQLKDDYIANFGSQVSSVGSRTVCAWFFSTSTARQGLVGTRNNADSVGFVLTINRTAAGDLTYFHTGGSTLEVAAGIATNTWYHACATLDTATAVATLYLNGASIGSASSFSVESASTHNGVLGDEGNGQNQPLFGSIDDVRIYNRALSAAEVKRLYHLGD